MNDVKVCKDCCVPKANIKYYLNYETATAKKDVREKRKEGKVIDLTGGKKIHTVIYLKSGELMIVTTSFDVISDRMEQCRSYAKEE